jgi:hypothetical protein
MSTLPNESKVSRRTFLTMAGAATVGIGIARTPLTALAADPLPALPWGPQYYPAGGLNADEVRKAAYSLYYLQGGCGHGSAQSIIDALAAQIPDPWSRLPRGLYSYGGGGAVGWGTICGALNGTLAVMDILGVHGKLGNALMDYYSTSELPTDALEGWVPDNPAVPIPLIGVPRTVSASPLCHNSMSKWAAVAGVPVANPATKDRCAKLVGDIVAYAVVLMNNHFLHGVTPAAWAPPASYATCYSCHTSADMVPSQQGKMDCLQCHEVAPAHGSWRRGNRGRSR